MAGIIEEDRVTATEVRQCAKDMEKWFRRQLFYLVGWAVLNAIASHLPPDWRHFKQRLRLQNKWQQYGYKSKES